MNHSSGKSLPLITWQKLGQFIWHVLKTIFQIVVFDIAVPSAVWVAKTIGAGIRRTFKRHRRWWRITPRAYKCYIIGQVIFLVGMIVQAKMKGATWPMAILIAASVLFFYGFASWSRPIVQKAISSPAGKWAYGIAHGFIAIFAIIVARTVVYDALKLPPQYFDVTVAVVVLTTYVPIWIGVIALTLAVLFAVMYLSWGIGQLLRTFCNQLIAPILGQPAWYVRAQRRMEMRSNKIYFHTLGVVTSLFFLAMLLDGIGYVTEHSMQGIRWVAYFADFQPAGNYPGVSCEGRIRLMDNGIVAVAKIVKYDIEIDRENVKAVTDPSHGCIAIADHR